MKKFKIIFLVSSLLYLPQAQAFSLYETLNYVRTSIKEHALLATGVAAVSAGLYYQYVYKPQRAAMRAQDTKTLMALEGAVFNQEFLLSVLEIPSIEVCVYGMGSLTYAQRVRLIELARSYDNSLMEGGDVAEIQKKLLNVLHSIITTISE